MGTGGSWWWHPHADMAVVVPLFTLVWLWVALAGMEAVQRWHPQSLPRWTLWLLGHSGCCTSPLAGSEGREESKRDGIGPEAVNNRRKLPVRNLLCPFKGLVTCVLLASHALCAQLSAGMLACAEGGPGHKSLLPEPEEWHSL